VNEEIGEERDDQPDAAAVEAQRREAARMEAARRDFMLSTAISYGTSFLFVQAHPYLVYVGREGEGLVILAMLCGVNIAAAVGMMVKGAQVATREWETSVVVIIGFWLIFEISILVTMF
jgi:hypothetical protein